METIANFGDEKLASEALARVKGQLAALSPEQLVQVNLDVQAAAGTVLGALPEIFPGLLAGYLPYYGSATTCDLGAVRVQLGAYTQLLGQEKQRERDAQPKM